MLALLMHEPHFKTKPSSVCKFALPLVYLLLVDDTPFTQPLKQGAGHKVDIEGMGEVVVESEALPHPTP